MFNKPTPLKAKSQCFTFNLKDLNNITLTLSTILQIIAICV
jgi:hypothetical protein